MDVLWIAVPAAILIISGAIAGFVWAVRSGQMDDLETPAIRMLHDDERTRDVRRDAGDEPGARPAGRDPRSPTVPRPEAR